MRSFCVEGYAVCQQRPVPLQLGLGDRRYGHKEHHARTFVSGGSQEPARPGGE